MKFQRPVLAIFLVAFFVFAGGVLSTQAVKHTVHHAHHKATTHTTALCSWMCAAGQVLQVADFGLNGLYLTLFVIDPWTPSARVSILAASPRSRAPPSA